MNIRRRTSSLLRCALAAGTLSTACVRADGVAVADAVATGLDTTRIRPLIETLREGGYGRHTSFLVLKDGRTVVEEYFDGEKPSKRRGVQSVSKSLTSLLVGYGIQQKYIASVDDPIAKYLPKYRHLLVGGKEKITVRHLLTMTSGLEWSEWNRPYGEEDNMRVRERASDDAVAFVLGRPLASQPGEVWDYNGGGMTVLAEILTTASGLSPKALVERAFAGLLDGDEIALTYQADGRVNAAGGFQVTPRGMAKIGQMVLQGGSWNGARLFDRRWIEESTGPAVPWRMFGYGFLWWRYRIHVGGRDTWAIEANGLGGQRIVVVPDAQLVIVTTAENFGREISFDSLMVRGVLPALLPPAAAARNAAPPKIDQALAYPRPPVGWRQILSESDSSNPARVRVWVDTLGARRLADGSHVVWLRTEFANPLNENGQRFDRMVSRFILRCETPTDGRSKRVSSTAFLGDSAVFQDAVGLDAAMAGPWTVMMSNSPDLVIDRRACALVSR